jgi:glycosyltransferase involved in cell wall biosynthesis
MDMEKLKKYNLAFFFDLGGSLKTWNDFGMLTREIAIYNLLAKKFGKIYFLTYGDKTEFEYKNLLAKNIIVLPKKISLPNTHFFNLVYEFLMPFCYFGKIRNCRFYKTNQNFGSIAPAISKILHPKSKLIVRSGYIASLNAELYDSPWYIKLYLWTAENLSYRFCDKALIPTKQNYDILAKKYPVLKKKLLEMNNFIDTDLFRKKDIEKKYDIIYVARLDKDKNHILLLEAAKNLDLKILFVGQGTEKGTLEKFARENDLNVEFVSRVPNNELPEYYNKSRMCVFPSLHEGNPKTLLEAMSCQLPVIGLDVLGVQNIIRHRGNGWLSKPDAKELRVAIQDLLQDPELCERMGKAARAYIEENFSLKKLLLKEIDVYEESIA